MYFLFSRTNYFNSDLGTVCLSRSDKPLFDKGKKSSEGKGRKNFLSLIKDITKDHLICQGKDESYNWKDVCLFAARDVGRRCKLKNGDILELNLG